MPPDVFTRRYDGDYDYENDQTPIDVDGKQVKMHWFPHFSNAGDASSDPDTAWMQKYARAIFHDCDVCALIYSISSEWSFEFLPRLWDLITEVKVAPVKTTLEELETRRDKGMEGRLAVGSKHIMVIGNKVDRSEQREVDDSDGRRLAAAIGGTYSTMSAKTGEGCIGFDQDIARMVEAAERQRQAHDTPTVEEPSTFKSPKKRFAARLVSCLRLR